MPLDSNHQSSNSIINKALIIAVLFISMLSLTNYFLAPKIIQTEQVFLQNQLKELIANINFDNNLLQSKMNISSKDQHIYFKYLYNSQNTQNSEYNKKTSFKPAYLAKYKNTPVAVILNPTAPDGYNGNIDLLVAISLTKSSNTIKYQPTIISIKVLQHNETPGLGDIIEPNKSDWLKNFTNKSADNTNTQDIDTITGATITSSAVIRAVNKAMLLIEQHPEFIELFDNETKK